ncbi:hypothetical protein TNIN_12901 [Trichonephila inaurata madagascariensis]|uniref:Uncharacterized protein n=1 Tax=Trichonephila inaurata madagascariensis TaxID=2747483 RepID=A0A8X6YIL9_9ARAC|nr:hypothetical protein TNIN_12901 [Trichonephila inaurata madagascariensis]
MGLSGFRGAPNSISLSSSSTLSPHIPWATHWRSSRPLSRERNSLSQASNYALLILPLLTLNREEGVAKILPWVLGIS